jgi:hypothetical protein
MTQVTTQAINLAGPVLVQTNATGSLAEYGMTAGGVTITSEDYTKNVPCDDHGGEDGIPADIQDLGSIHRIRLEMTKYNAAMALLLEGKVKGYSGGAARPVGTLVMTGGKYFTLKLLGTTETRTYTCATPLGQPHDVNKGSIYSRHVVEFRCFPDPTTGKLYSEA